MLYCNKACLNLSWYNLMALPRELIGAAELLTYSQEIL